MQCFLLLFFFKVILIIYCYDYAHFLVSWTLLYAFTIVFFTTVASHQLLRAPGINYLINSWHLILALFNSYIPIKLQLLYKYNFKISWKTNQWEPSLRGICTVNDGLMIHTHKHTLTHCVAGHNETPLAVRLRECLRQN